MQLNRYHCDIEVFYASRDAPLSFEDKEIVGLWGMGEMDLCWNAWSDDWHKNTDLPMPALHSHMAKNCSEEKLRMMFFAVSQYECCKWHMGNAPVAIDSDETTPKKGGYCGCQGKRRTFLRILKRALEELKNKENEETARA